MPVQKEKILSLKEKRIEKNLSTQDVYNMAVQKGFHISKSSVTRVFKDGSENLGFRYKETIEPIELVLEDDNSGESEKIKTIKEYYEKEITQLHSVIDELKYKIDHEKRKSDDKIDKERDNFAKERESFNLRIAQLNQHVTFLEGQIKLKDERMDQKDKRYDKLFERFDKKEEKMDRMLDQFLKYVEKERT